MKVVVVILFLTFALVAPFPNPQDEDDGAPQPPAPGSKPPDFLASLPTDDQNGGEKSKGEGKEPECGPTCMLVNQTPIILLICILVVVILLLVILFGCYFIKKLHGKVIFTTGHRHRNLLGNERDVGISKVGGEYVEKKTFESVTPGLSERKSVVTTTTTKVIQSGASSTSRDATLESPLRSTDRII